MRGGIDGFVGALLAPGGAPRARRRPPFIKREKQEEMSPPSWVLKLGDKLRSETTALGDKLRTETTAFVELLETPSPNDTINVPISSATAVARGALPSSSSDSGFMELVAVTTFLALLVARRRLVLMEEFL